MADFTRGALLPALLLAGCGGSPVERAAFPQPLNLQPDVEYVGQDACRDCHLEQFASYQHTGMGRAFYPMSPEEAVEDFSGNNEFVVEESGLHYRMEQRDGKYFQTQFMLDSEGRRTAYDERELIYVLGSNHHSRSYVTVTDGKLFQAPACWYPQEQIWELCPGYEFKNDHFAREITHGCIHCHNGVMDLVAGERNRYEEPYPHGIGCERCHGPGQLHVERWSNGSETPLGETDLTVVNPRRLPREERIEVCFQCHLGDAKASERVIRYDRQVSSFRPGQRITEIVVPFRYRQQTIHDFGLSAQADRLLQSRCYKESGGQIECLTCHNPHITVYHEDHAPDFRQKCLSCHAVEDCGAADESRQATEPADDCVACHMRKAEPDDQRFTEFTDHWIRRDIRVLQRDHRDEFAVEPIFPERLTGLPAGQKTFYYARALALLSEDAPASKRRPMWEEAERTFRQAIEEGLDNQHAWFFLGKVRTFLGQHRAADTAFEKAYEHDPTYLDAAFAWAQALIRRGELDRALGVLNGMLEQDPDSTMALAEAGRAMSMLGRPGDALGYFERALRREPWNPTLHVNQGRVLAQLGRFDEAAGRARQAVKNDPDNPEMWHFYEKVHDAAGLPDEAARGRLFVQRLSK